METGLKTKNLPEADTTMSYISSVTPFLEGET